jgi:glycosyltransferase involved in cell wall biosynthesis
VRILIASDYYPPFIGGAHRQTRLLAQEFARRGHDVAVATIWYPGSAETATEDGFTVHRVRQVRTAVRTLARPGQHHQPSFPDPVTAWQLRRIARAFRPDVVHAYGGIAFSAGVALRGLRTPLVIAARDYGYGCPTRTLVNHDRICPGPSIRRCPACAMRYYGPAKGLIATGGLTVSRPILRRSIDGLHSISTYVDGTVRRDLLHAMPLPGIIVPSFREDSSTVATAGDSAIVRQLDSIPDPFILFVGALRREKGIEELLTAYEALALERRPPLVLIGTIERDTPLVFPEGVVVVENASIPEVLAAWDRAAFGVLPSRWPEPLGSVVYEAMSRGKAVIGTRPGGHEDMIVDGESGLLVPAGDPSALERAMYSLITDEGLRTRLGAAAQSRADIFVAARSVPRLERFLEDVASGRVTA